MLSAWYDREVKRIGRFIFDGNGKLSLGLLGFALVLWMCVQIGMRQLNWSGSGYRLDVGREGLTYEFCRPSPPASSSPGLEEPMLEIRPVQATVRIPVQRTKVFVLPGFRYEWGPAMTGTLIIGGQTIPAFLDESQAGYRIVIQWWLMAFAGAPVPLLWSCWQRWRRAFLLR